MKKALHTAKVACMVLIFNTLCISIFCFLVPILVISRLVENIISILSDCYTALKEENTNLINKYKTEPQKTETQLPKYDHNSIGLN